MGLLDLIQSLSTGQARNRMGGVVDSGNTFTGAMTGLGNILGGAARGSLAATLGLPGDINQAIVNNIGSAFPNAPAAPTTAQWEQLLPYAPTSPEGQTYQKIGNYLPITPSMVTKSAQAAKDLPLGMSIMTEEHPNWDKMMGDAAKMMEERGASPEEIHKVTGTFKTPEGEWAQGNQSIEDFGYRGSHKAPNPEFGAPLHDLTGGGEMYPADVYSDKAAQYYGTGNSKADKEVFDLAKKVRGNPDAEVTMYRAVPKDVNNINAGDWVTLSKNYAKNHGESVLRNDYKILSQKVKAKELWTNADSIHEFGYNPEKETRK